MCQQRLFRRPVRRSASTFFPRRPFRRQRTWPATPRSCATSWQDHTNCILPRRQRSRRQPYLLSAPASRPLTLSSWPSVSRPLRDVVHERGKRPIRSGPDRTAACFTLPRRDVTGRASAGGPSLTFNFLPGQGRVPGRGGRGVSAERSYLNTYAIDGPNRNRLCKSRSYLSISAGTGFSGVGGGCHNP